MMVMTGGPSYTTANFGGSVSANIVGVGSASYVEYKVFMDCSNTGCFQNWFPNTSGGLPPVGACREEKFCIKTDNVFGSQGPWELVPCVGPVELPDYPTDFGS